MAQNQNILHQVTRYTRVDYTALRAVMNKVPYATIFELYYCDDDREALGLETAGDLRRRIDTMRDELIARASDVNPHLASFLQDARRTSIWSHSAISVLAEAADADMFSPRPSDYLSFWFRPRVANRLNEEECRTVIDLSNLINMRGTGWYLPIPRIGEKVAKRIEKWFDDNASVRDLIDRDRLLPAKPLGSLVLIDRDSTVPVPLEMLQLSSDLDGHNGINRADGHCMISARNDLGAAIAYLKKHEVWQKDEDTGVLRNVSKTFRAYQREIERFILWCVLEKKTPMSSILGEECEEYKQFLASPAAHWVGPREKRGSSKWKPFTGSMSPRSQLYAVRALRYFFNYLIDIRYLMGNPWKAVSDPVTVTEELPIQIEKALSSDLWQKLAAQGGILDWYCEMEDQELKKHFIPYGIYRSTNMQKQMRLIRAAILLMGETGLRREEAARATREALTPLQGNNALWELKVIGKGRKARTVIVPSRVVEAIRSHWADWENPQNFEFQMAAFPLLSPIIIPQTAEARKRHIHLKNDKDERRDRAFTTDSLGRMVAKALTNIANDNSNPYLTPSERNALLKAAAHALRHTFGTIAVEEGVPLDTVQKALGHASLQTTTIYVQAERKRMIAEFAKREERRARHVKLKIDSAE